MRNFEYRAPRSLKEAAKILSQNGSNIYMLAGGTDLIPKMRGGRITPQVVVDVKRISELVELHITENELVFGAGVPCRVFNDSNEIAKQFPAIRDSSYLIGGIQIQGRASIGGNLCNASPSADSIPTLIALDGQAIIRRAEGDIEKVAIRNFCTGPGSTILQPGDLLTHIHIPRPKARQGSAYLRFTPRNEMDIAVANAAVSVTLGADNRTIQKAHIVLGSVGPTAIVAKTAGDSLAGKVLSSENLISAARLAAEDARPIADMRGSIEHRKQLSFVLVKRAMKIAVQRAKEMN